MEIRMNAGYIITDSIHIGDVEFVLGVSRNTPVQFVTWECRDENNYYWGHYLSDHLAALHDLLERSMRELDAVERQQNQKSLHGKKQKECER